MERRGRRKLARDALVVLGLLFLSGLAFPAGLPILEVREDGGSSAPAAADPVRVRISLSDPPIARSPLSGSIELLAQWATLEGVSVSIEGDPQVSPRFIGDLPARLEAGVATAVPFVLTPAQPGIFSIAFRVAGYASPWGRLGGVESVHLEVLPSGAGRISIGNAFPPTEVGPAVPAPANGAFGSLDGRRTPFRPPPGHVGATLPLPARIGGRAAEGNGGGPTSHGTFLVTGRWSFWLEDDIHAAPQRWASVEVRDDDGAGSYEVLWSGLTESDGSFVTADLPREESDCCLRGNQDVYVVFFASNGAVRVETAPFGQVYAWATDVTTIGSEDVLDVGSLASGSSEFAQRPFEYANNAWDYVARAGFASELTLVRIRIPDACTFYTLADDTIHLCADGVDDKSPDDVGHEFGHYVHDKLYADAYWPSPGGTHFLCADDQHRGLAWTEGFANFFGPRVGFEIVDPSDAYYSRPWDGSIFSLNMEATPCAGVLGDDNEMNVATALWDLADAPDDGSFDRGIVHPADEILGAIVRCDQADYRAYYDGGRCNWVSRGRPAFDFVATAWQNEIDYNVAPIAMVTSQAIPGWVARTLPLTADVVDPDSPVQRVVFATSEDASCSDSDSPVEADSQPPYAAAVNVSSMADSTSLWTCAMAQDAFEQGPWAVSASPTRIDNSVPTLVVTPSGTAGQSAWYTSSVTVHLAATDAASGLSVLEHSLDSGPWRAYEAPIAVPEDGTHVLFVRSRDLAGNVAFAEAEFSVDGTRPIVIIETPGQGSTHGDAPVFVGWAGSDGTSGIGSCRLAVDGGTPSEVDPAGGVWLPDLADGEHTLRISCVDLAGNEGESGLQFRVDRLGVLLGRIGPPIGLGAILVCVGYLLLRKQLRRRV